MENALTGINLNHTASRVLGLIHPAVPIRYRKCLGSENVRGVRKPLYSGPIEAMAQVQAPDPETLRKADMGNDAKNVRAFWIDADLAPTRRPDGKGPDIIEYDGRAWLVTAIPDNFRIVGWVCVLAEMQLDP